MTTQNNQEIIKMATSVSLPTMAKDRNISQEEWNSLTQVIFPEAKDQAKIALAFDYCKTRGLDVMKKPVAIVPMWNSKTESFEEKIWTTIVELRITAARTNLYAGIDSPVLGAILKRTFSKKPYKNKGIDTYEVSFPEWCEVSVYRLVKGEKQKFTQRVYWLESYGESLGTPNSMWRDRPIGQLIKCAEAAALRSAFPEEMGGIYTAEEMEGKEIAHDITPAKKEDVLANKVFSKVNDAIDVVVDDTKNAEKEITPDPTPENTVEVIAYEVTDSQGIIKRFRLLDKADQYLKVIIGVAEVAAKKELLESNIHIVNALEGKGLHVQANYLRNMVG